MILYEISTKTRKTHPNVPTKTNNYYTVNALLLIFIQLKNTTLANKLFKKSLFTRSMKRENSSTIIMRDLSAVTNPFHTHLLSYKLHNKGACIILSQRRPTQLIPTHDYWVVKEELRVGMLL